jgi:Protein of unknown function (DUF4087)
MYKIGTRRGLTIFGSLLLATVVFGSGDARPAGEPATAEFETRCGWFSNPTPANISLYDRDAEWTIGVQGGYQVSGDWDWPVFKAGQWVQTNGNYGYGCACLQLRVNKENHDVLEIKSARARSLTACRQDPVLKKWKRLFK